jgi:hypothetical protein
MFHASHLSLGQYQLVQSSVNGCPTLQASGYERTTIELTISPGDGVFRNIRARGFALVISLSQTQVATQRIPNYSPYEVQA